MSIKRVRTIAHARKPQGKCTSCGDEINVGDGYRYWKPGFRSRYKVRRCMKSGCTPRPSELESSKMSQILAAMEDAEAVANAFEEGGEEISELTQALEDVQSAIEEVAAEYREADDNFGGTGGTESGMKADDLESVYLDASFEEFDAGTVLEGDDLEAAQADWRAEQAQILRDALEEIPV